MYPSSVPLGLFLVILCFFSKSVCMHLLRSVKAFYVIELFLFFFLKQTRNSIVFETSPKANKGNTWKGTNLVRCSSLGCSLHYPIEWGITAVLHWGVRLWAAVLHYPIDPFCFAEGINWLPRKTESNNGSFCLSFFPVQEILAWANNILSKQISQLKLPRSFGKLAEKEGVLNKKTPVPTSLLCLSGFGIVG